MEQEIKIILSKYIPEVSVEDICGEIIKHQVRVTITRSRKRVHGTYCRPVKNHSHRITVNNNLNPYTFLVTLLHEFAHLYAWKYKKSLQHDDNWKNYFSAFILKHIDKNAFPSDVKNALLNHLNSIKSSDFLDVELTKTLQKYDILSEKEQGLIFLSDLPMESVFYYENRTFVKFCCPIKLAPANKECFWS